ncbi:MAG: hypothetical protein P4L34_05345 [Paludibacter sp.]|nr:hypothetical protein [Paludibacter sp.]
MKKSLLLFTLLAFFVACKSDKDKQNEKIVTTIENVGLNNFLNIEYSPTEKTEKYNYFRGDSLVTSWDYNLIKKCFENFNKTKMKAFTTDPQQFMESLRNKIKSTNIVLITQTQWTGKVLNFWINDTELISYVNPVIKCDSATQASLDDELRYYSKIKENWYYRKIIVCTNK